MKAIVGAITGISIILAVIVMAIGSFFLSGIGSLNVFMSLAFSTMSIVLFWKNILEKNLASWWLLLILFITNYLIIVLGLVVFEKVLYVRLMTLDTDHDGVFSVREQTAEQIKILAIYTNDLGRRMLVFLGLVYSLVTVVVYFFFIQIIRRLWTARPSRQSPR